MVKLHRLNDVRKDLIQRSLEGSIPVLYFKKIINVGDLVSVYLIERISRRPVHAVSTVFLPHLAAVGSTIGSSSKQSYIWGSGSIDGKVPLRGVDPAKIFALRGKRTQALLEQITGQRITVPLGDPAVLMPNFYDRAVPITHEIGLIPHFDEIDSLFGLFRQSFEGVKLIDPRMVPEVSRLLQRHRCHPPDACQNTFQRGSAGGIHHSTYQRHVPQNAHPERRATNLLSR